MITILTIILGVIVFEWYYVTSLILPVQTKDMEISNDQINSKMYLLIIMRSNN